MYGYICSGLVGELIHPFSLAWRRKHIIPPRTLSLILTWFKLKMFKHSLACCVAIPYSWRFVKFDAISHQQIYNASAFLYYTHAHFLPPLFTSCLLEKKDILLTKSSRNHTIARVWFGASCHHSIWFTWNDLVDGHCEIK